MTDDSALRYCPDLFSYQRRESREVKVGGVGVGGDNPVRIQSMITSDTRDTEACVKEVLGLAEAGCEIVRITAQTVKYAANLEHIRDGVRGAGCEVPLVADIHFKPDAAMEAAKWVEKVRVNPGNFVDKKKFEVREYSDEDYEEELQRIRGKFVPLVERCQEMGRAMRIGTNHGSLSDRIMNRYGDTPLGMVESALEFARIGRELDYHEIIFSMKASNPKVMIEAYRLLVARLELEGSDWNYPIHLGVTEAGDGEDGRIKSAIGIGSLLADGIGDTIRVSLTEDAVHEVPVARALAEVFEIRGGGVSPQAVASRRGCLNQDVLNYSPNWEELAKHTSSYLPHWETEGGVYAVTFRLADSLPAAALEQYRTEHERILQKIVLLEGEFGSRSCGEDLKKLREEEAALQSTVIEPVLHEGHGKCWLGDEAIAGIVCDALKYFDGQRYELLAWCVMPNHVHVLVSPSSGESLAKILHAWKSFTAKEANRTLGRGGVFWQAEYFDHLVRDGDDYRNQLKYILQNPTEPTRWVGSAYGDTWEAVEGDCVGARRPDHGLGRDAPATVELLPSWDPFSYERRHAEVMEIGGHELGGDKVVRVFTSRRKWDAVGHKIEAMGDFKPEIVVEDSGVAAVDPRDAGALAALNGSEEVRLVTVADGVDLGVIPAFRMLAAKLDARHPILLKDVLERATDAGADFLETLLTASRRIGSLLCDGIGDAILVQGEEAPGQSLRLSYNILQAAGTRIFKTDYVACPSCGRTLFNLQSTTQKIREATGHLKGVRIAVMGCIVNGPGEMADADFGYVGGAPGKINLYVGKESVKFNIPEGEAVERLIDLINEHGKWIDPPVREEVEVS